MTATYPLARVQNKRSQPMTNKDEMREELYYQAREVFRSEVERDTIFYRVMKVVDFVLDWQAARAGKPVKLNQGNSDQVAAWQSVAKLLNELSPGWILQPGLSGEEAAIKTIRELAACAGGEVEASL